MTEDKENKRVENSSSITYYYENLSVMDTGRSKAYKGGNFDAEFKN
jgi:hypothetical protein